MRHVKRFGLVTIFAAAAIAVTGASSALANFNTQVCKTGATLVCPGGDAVTEVHVTLEKGTIGKLLSSLVNILCLDVLVTATLEGLGKPQEGKAGLSFTTCGTNSSHNNCVLTTLEKPSGTLLKTAAGEGVLTATGGLLNVYCEDIFFGVDIDCHYTAQGQEITLDDESQVGIAENAPVTRVEGGSLCPDEALIDGVVVPLETLYIRS